MKKIILIILTIVLSGCAAQRSLERSGTDITYSDKVTGASGVTGQFSSDDANEIKTAVNSKEDHNSNDFDPDRMAGDVVDNNLVDPAIGGFGLDVSACTGHIDWSSGTATCIKDSFAQVAAPTVDDDADFGYAIGSRWYDTTNHNFYTLQDATDGAADWDCYTCSSVSALNDLGNPSASKSFSMAAYTLTFTSSTDGWGGLLLTNTAADNSSNTTLLSLKFNDAADDNSIWLDVVEDADGTPASIVKGYGRTLLLTNVALTLGSGSSIAGVGAVDLGAVTVEITNGASPTTDSAGEIAIRTGADEASGIQLYGNVSPGSSFIPIWQSRCQTWAGIAAASDHMFHQFPYAITVRQVRVTQRGATNVVGHLDECDSAGASCVGVDGATDITATTTATDDGTLSNSSIDADDVIQWHTTSVSGTNTDCMVCLYYTVN